MKACGDCYFADLMIQKNQKEDFSKVLPERDDLEEEFKERV